MYRTIDENFTRLSFAYWVEKEVMEMLYERLLICHTIEKLNEIKEQFDLAKRNKQFCKCVRFYSQGAYMVEKLFVDIFKQNPSLEETWSIYLQTFRFSMELAFVSQETFEIQYPFLIPINFIKTEAKFLIEIFQNKGCDLSRYEIIINKHQSCFLDLEKVTLDQLNPDFKIHSTGIVRQKRCDGKYALYNYSLLVSTVNYIGVGITTPE